MIKLQKNKRFGGKLLGVLIDTSKQQNLISFISIILNKY